MFLNIVWITLKTVDIMLPWQPMDNGPWVDLVKNIYVQEKKEKKKCNL